MFEGEKTRFWIPGEARVQGQERAVRHAGVRRRADQDRVEPRRDRSSRTGFRPARCRRPAVTDRRVARWKRSASARRTWSGTGTDPRPAPPAPAARPRPRRAAAVVVGLAADRVGGQRFFQHRRQPRRSATAPRRPPRPRPAERGGERLDPHDERLHLLAVGVGIEIGAGERRRPARDDARRTPWRSDRRARARGRGSTPRERELAAASGRAADARLSAEADRRGLCAGRPRSSARLRPDRTAPRARRTIASRAATRSPRAMSWRCA